MILKYCFNLKGHNSWRTDDRRFRMTHNTDVTELIVQDLEGQPAMVNDGGIIQRFKIIEWVHESYSYRTLDDDGNVWVLRFDDTTLYLEKEVIA